MFKRSADFQWKMALFTSLFGLVLNKKLLADLTLDAGEISLMYSIEYSQVIGKCILFVIESKPKVVCVNLEEIPNI